MKLHPFSQSVEIPCIKVKVKCTLVQALRLCTGRTAHRGSRGIALLFHDHGTRRGWGVSVTPWPLFTPGKDPVPIVQEAGWAPGPVWTGAEYLAPTGIQSPDHPARSQSLYRLSYLAHNPLHPLPLISVNFKTDVLYLSLTDIGIISPLYFLGKWVLNSAAGNMGDLTAVIFNSKCLEHKCELWEFIQRCP